MLGLTSPAFEDATRWPRSTARRTRTFASAGVGGRAGGDQVLCTLVRRYRSGLSVRTPQLLSGRSLRRTRCRGEAAGWLMLRSHETAPCRKPTGVRTPGYRCGGASG
jgi:hypothetical protein